MRLNEALCHWRKGMDIKRKCWSLTLKESMYDSGKEGLLVTLREKDIDADDWEVVPKYVGFNKAVEALSENKVIVAEDTELNRKHFRLDCDHKNLMYRNNECCEWATYSFGIPLRWLHKDNFEILEEC